MADTPRIVDPNPGRAGNLPELRVCFRVTVLKMDRKGQMSCTHGCPYASKPEPFGVGNVASVKEPTATTTMSGALASSQYTVEPHAGQK